METPEIHVKQTLFRRPMPDYKYLNPKSQGKPKLTMKDMGYRFFFEKPRVATPKCQKIRSYWLYATRDNCKYPG